MRFKKLCLLRFPQRNEYEDKDLPKRMKSPKDKFSGLLSDRQLVCTCHRHKPRILYKRLTYFHGTCIETFIHCYIVVNSVPWFEPFNRWVVFQINPLCEQFIRKWKRCNQCSRNAPFLTHQNLVVRSVKSVLKYIFTAVILWTKWSFMIWYVFRGHERIYVEVK